MRVETTESIQKEGKARDTRNPRFLHSKVIIIVRTYRI